MDLKHLQEMIEGIGKELLGPKDDWLPTLFLEKDSQVAIIAMDLMGSGPQKEIAAKIMYDIIKRTNPDVACFVSTSWVADQYNKWDSKESFDTAYSLGLVKRPSEHPDRKEVVTAIMVDLKKSALMIGYIKRSFDKPPEIVRWRTEAVQTAEISGRFGDAMRMGFKDADKKGNLDILNEMKRPGRTPNDE